MGASVGIREPGFGGGLRHSPLKQDFCNEGVSTLNTPDSRIPIPANRRVA
jgi:hypothetical protein